jgi:CBS domain-containing protein
MTVKSILSTKGDAVTTASTEHSMQDVANTLAAKKIGAIVVTDPAGAILGIVSERDVVRAVARGGPEALKDSVKRHMTEKVVTTTVDKTIVSVMEDMTRGRFRHMPVVSSGRLAGILSIGDIVKHRLEEMEREQSALRDYIHST